MIPRRRLQFRLRTLLLAFVVLGAWLGFRTNDAYRRQCAGHALLELGARIETKTPDGRDCTAEAARDAFAAPTVGAVLFGRDEVRLVGVDLHGTVAGDEQMPLLSVFPTLRRIDIADTRVTDEGLRKLAGLAALESLSTSHSLISQDGLEVLQTLPKLEYLDIDVQLIDRRAIEHLKRMHGLRILSLSGLGPNDAQWELLLNELPDVAIMQ